MPDVDLTYAGGIHGRRPGIQEGKREQAAPPVVVADDTSASAIRFITGKRSPLAALLRGAFWKRRTMMTDAPARKSLALPTAKRRTQPEKQQQYNGWKS